MNLSIQNNTEGSNVSLIVKGEVDVSNAGELRSALEAAAEAAPESIEVNLAEVSYIDSTGIGVLVGAAHSAEEAKRSFSVVSPQPNVKRVLGLLGVEKDLNVEE